MLKHLVMAVSLILPLAAGAGGPKTSDAFTVQKDLATSEAVAKCETSLSGLDRAAPYSGVVRFLFDNPYDDLAPEEYYVKFHVDPANPTFSETGPGIYSLTATFKRQTIAVAFNFQRNLQTQDQLYCWMQIVDTPVFDPNRPYVTLHYAEMRYSQP